MKRLAVVVSLLLSIAAHAVTPQERLSDPVLEARARIVSSELRCLVCQNESIDDSGADLAHDIRVLVRERMTAGDSNAQTIQAVVDRYGAFVLLNPPVQPATYILWYGPIAMVVLGLIAIAVWLRGQRPAAASPPAPLTAGEIAELNRLLPEKDG
jgi:cytochrome c-type biogenesis protein CcmH